MRALARLGCSSCSMDTCGWDSWDPPAFFQARNPWFLLELRPSSVQHGHAVMVLDCKHAAGRKSLAVMRCSLRTDMPWQCQIRLRHPSRYSLHGLFHSWRVLAAATADNLSVFRTLAVLEHAMSCGWKLQKPGPIRLCAGSEIQLKAGCVSQ